MTSSIPAGYPSIIPTRFRVFSNYDLSNTGIEGKVVQPGTLRALMYQIFSRGFLTARTPFSDDSIWPGSRDICQPPGSDFSKNAVFLIT
jgi:hypothetical protein